MIAAERGRQISCDEGGGITIKRLVVLEKEEAVRGWATGVGTHGGVGERRQVPYHTF